MRRHVRRAVQLAVDDPAERVCGRAARGGGAASGAAAERQRGRTAWAESVAAAAAAVAAAATGHGLGVRPRLARRRDRGGAATKHSGRCGRRHDGGRAARAAEGEQHTSHWNPSLRPCPDPKLDRTVTPSRTPTLTRARAPAPSLPATLTRRAPRSDLGHRAQACLCPGAPAWRRRRATRRSTAGASRGSCGAGGSASGSCGGGCLRRAGFSAGLWPAASSEAGASGRR